MKVLALDYGSARTGVAVSDATGVLARPVDVIRRIADEAGLARLDELIREHEPELVLVGMPLTLRGEMGEQAIETENFVAALRTRLSVPIDTWDERFTTRLAGRDGSATAEDALAAAHLLQSWLDGRAR